MHDPVLLLNQIYTCIHEQELVNKQQQVTSTCHAGHSTKAKTLENDAYDYWEPADSVNELYQQISSSGKYREITHNKIE